LASIGFANDANRLVLYPVENMIAKVETIRNNPLQAMKVADEEFKVEEINRAKAAKQEKSRLQVVMEWTGCSSKKDNTEIMETVILEKTIIKLGSLLALGFGEAGANIIEHNMHGVDSACVDAMVEGTRVECIIGATRIRDFSTATEVLQAKVMTFVNQIAEIVHGVVDEFHGAANKNNGDTFLVIWRMGDIDKVSKLADMSILAFTRILGAIHRTPVLAAYRGHPGLQQRLGKDCRVNLSSGLHYGWAIEGAVGSEFKIDASYLSPNVSIAETVERATQIYGVSVLVAESVVSICSTPMATKCRLIDRVIITGSVVPMDLYVIDLDYLGLTVEQPLGPQRWTTRDRFKVRQFLENEKEQKWADGVKMVNLFNENADIASMRFRYTLEFIHVFNMGYQNYSQGEWQVAQRLLQRTRDMLGVEDGPSVALLKFMERTNYEAWRAGLAADLPGGSRHLARHQRSGSLPQLSAFDWQWTSLTIGSCWVLTMLTGKDAFQESDCWVQSLYSKKYFDGSARESPNAEISEPRSEKHKETGFSLAKEFRRLCVAHSGASRSMIFLGGLPGLGVFILFLTALCRAELCLPNGIPEGQRLYVLNASNEQSPIRLTIFAWRSSIVTSQIAQILISEVLGYHALVTPETIFDTTAGISRLAGCESSDCQVKTSRTDVVLDTWLSPVFPFWQGFLAQNPQVAEDLGSMGYQGGDGLYIKGSVLESAANAGLALEYYKSYNMSFHQPYKYFDTLWDLPEADLEPCNGSFLGWPLEPTDSEKMKNYLDWTGDVDGVVERNGQYSANCQLPAFWIAPACRHNYTQCIPVMQNGPGYMVVLMQWSVAYGIPMALTHGTTGTNVMKAIRNQRILYYWFEPDETLLDLRHARLILPPHSAAGWLKGDFRTGGEEVYIAKLANVGLQISAPRVRTFVQKMKLEVGYGLVDVQGLPVASLAEAVDCQVCAAGRFSEVFTQVVPAVELKSFGRQVRLCKLGVKRNGLNLKERHQQALVIVLKDGICQPVNAKSASRAPLVQAQESCDPGAVLRCFGNSLRCPGGAPETCAEGRDPSSPACSSCLPGLQPIGEQCMPCKGGDYIKLVALTLLVLVGTGILHIVLALTDRTSGSYRSALLGAALCANQLITCAQLFVVMEQIQDITWSEPFLSFLEFFRVLSLERLLDSVKTLSCVARISPEMNFLIRNLMVPASFTIGPVVAQFTMSRTSFAKTSSWSCLLKTCLDQQKTIGQCN
ncbi:unnamed protein product, partial [Cladocopium goreaui]